MTQLASPACSSLNQAGVRCNVRKLYAEACGAVEGGRVLESLRACENVLCIQAMPVCCCVFLGAGHLLQRLVPTTWL